MEDEDKSLVDIMKHSNIQEYEKFKYQFNLLLLLGVLCWLRELPGRRILI